MHKPDWYEPSWHRSTITWVVPAYNVLKYARCSRSKQRTVKSSMHRNPSISLLKMHLIYWILGMITLYSVRNRKGTLKNILTGTFLEARPWRWQIQDLCCLLQLLKDLCTLTSRLEHNLLISHLLIRKMTTHSFHNFGRSFLVKLLMLLLA